MLLIKTRVWVGPKRQYISDKEIPRTEYEQTYSFNGSLDDALIRLNQNQKAVTESSTYMVTEHTLLSVQDINISDRDLLSKFNVHQIENLETDPKNI